MITMYVTVWLTTGAIMTDTLHYETMKECLDIRPAIEITRIVEPDVLMVRTKCEEPAL